MRLPLGDWARAPSARLGRSSVALATTVAALVRDAAAVVRVRRARGLRGRDRAAALVVAVAVEVEVGLGRLLGRGSRSEFCPPFSLLGSGVFSLFGGLL